MLGVQSFKVFVEDLAVYCVVSMELQSVREGFFCMLCSVNTETRVASSF